MSTHGNNNTQQQKVSLFSVLNKSTAFGWLFSQVENVCNIKKPISWDTCIKKCDPRYSPLIFNGTLIEHVLLYLDTHSILHGSILTCRYWYLVVSHIDVIWKITSVSTSITKSDLSHIGSIHGIQCLKTITKFSKQILDRRDEYNSPREQFIIQDLPSLLIPSQYPKQFKITYDSLYDSRRVKKFSIKQYKVLLRGSPHSGKSTILKMLKIHDQIPVTATIDFRMEDSFKETMFRPFLKSNTSSKNASGFIFVIDCSDQMRFKQSMDTLFATMNEVVEPARKDFPLLIMCNKFDKILTSRSSANYITLKQVDQYISKLTFIGRRPIRLCYTSSVTGLGLYEGLSWLASEIEAAM
jgi:hypothetical protein